MLGMGPLGLPDRVSGAVLGLQELKSSVMLTCLRPAAEAGVVPGGRVWWDCSLPGTMGAGRAGIAVSATPFCPMVRCMGICPVRETPRA